jgi:hypothetical protein
MSLPKKIKIGYVDLDIIVVPKNSKFSKDNYGEYDSKTNSIRVAEGQRKIEELSTLLHEILHAICWQSSLSSEGGILEKNKLEEVVVNSIANNLTQVFKENPALLSYIKESVNGIKKTRVKAIPKNKKQYKKY